MLHWLAGRSSDLSELSREPSPCTWGDDATAQSSIGFQPVFSRIVERCFPGNQLLSRSSDWPCADKLSTKPRAESSSPFGAKKNPC
jgi:hypothetical protein